MTWKLSRDEIIRSSKQTCSPAQFCEDGGDGVSSALDGSDGVFGAARPEAAAVLGGFTITTAITTLTSHWFGLEHDGAFGLVHQRELAKPVVHGVPAEKK